MGKREINAGFEIQQRVAYAKNYNYWIYTTIASFVGKRILDVGCGLGNITQYLLDRESIVGIDILDSFVAEMGKRFSSYPNFKIIKGTITDKNVLRLKEMNFDTIICLNVLEHIENDRQALRNMFELLPHNGRLILLTPAIKFLYGTMDAADGHYRRYTKRELRVKLKNSGFIVKKQFYMNLLGILGWYLNGKILRKRFIPVKGYAVYDKFVWFLSKFERIFTPPIGLSIITGCIKP